MSESWYETPGDAVYPEPDREVLLTIDVSTPRWVRWLPTEKRP